MKGAEDGRACRKGERRKKAGGKEIEEEQEIWWKVVAAEDKNLHKPPIKSRVVY